MAEQLPLLRETSDELVSRMISRMDTCATSALNKRKDIENSGYTEAKLFYASCVYLNTAADMFQPARIKSFVENIASDVNIREYVNETITRFIIGLPKNDIARLVRDIAEGYAQLTIREHTALPEDWANELGAGKETTELFLISNSWYLVPLLLTLKEHDDDQEEENLFGSFNDERDEAPEYETAGRNRRGRRESHKHSYEGAD